MPFLIAFSDALILDETAEAAYTRARSLCEALRRPVEVYQVFRAEPVFPTEVPETPTPKVG